VLTLLDSFHEFFDGFWSGRLELTPYEEQGRVFLFDSFYKYNELLGFDARRLPVRPQGHYISLVNVMVINTRSGSPDNFADTLVHEAAHQLIDREIAGGRIGVMSTWLNEGLASYFGFTFRDKKGAFHAGRIGGKSTALLRDAPGGGNGDAARHVKGVRAATKSPEWREWVIPGLIDASGASFYDNENVLLNYSTAWLLVHFLLHGEDGRYADGFARYVEAELAGRGGSETLFEILGVDAGELRDAFVAYVRKVKT
jgi:hypothetical protein